MQIITKLVGCALSLSLVTNVSAQPSNGPKLQDLVVRGNMSSTPASYEIRGLVLSADEQPIIGANVKLLSGKKLISGATTNSDGLFSIKSGAMGVYDVEISCIGYKPYRMRINIGVEASEIVLLGLIRLEEDSQTLMEVEILGRQRRDYNSDYSYSATKIPIRNIDLAGAVSTVTKELIKDRQAFRIGEAIKGASSVQQIGFYNHFNIRGITQNAFGQVVNGMRTNQVYFAQPLTQNVERIEILKGPGSISLSSADPGGTINLVTKKPLRDKQREVNLTLGSFHTLRGGLDFTGPLNEDRTLLYRLNIGVQKAKSFRDLVENNGMLISPSVSYIPNDRTAINIELSYTESRGKLDRGQPTFGDTKTKEDIMRTPISMSIASATDYYNTSEIIGTVSLSQKLSEQLKFNAQYMKQVWNEDMREHRTNRRFVKDEQGVNVPNLVQLRYWERNQNWNTDALNAFFSYDWKIGSAQSTTVLGYDFNNLIRPKGNGQYQARGVAKNPDGSIILEDYTNPVTKQKIKIQKSLAGYYDLLGGNQELKVYKDHPLKVAPLLVQDYATHSAYLQNLTKWGKLHLLLGLRHEWVVEKINVGAPNEAKETYRKLIPRVGVSYSISKELSAYATYLQGFQSQSQAAEAMPAVMNYASEAAATHLKPLESELMEAGVKTELFGGKLRGTLSLFQIKQKNIPMTDKDDKIVLRGSDRSRGVELEVAGYITPELQISAAYSYIDAIITADAKGDLVGQRKEATPKHNGSLWAKYSFASGSPLRGLTLGFGLQHSSDRLSWYERNLTLPAYTVSDAVIGYKVIGTGLEFALKVNNVFDTTYWTGALDMIQVFPGSPRNVMFNTIFRF